MKSNNEAGNIQEVLALNQSQLFNEFWGICSGKIYTDLTRLVDNIKDRDNPKICPIRSQTRFSAKYSRILIQNQFIWIHTWKKSIHLLFLLLYIYISCPMYTSLPRPKSKLVTEESWIWKKTGFWLSVCQIQWCAGTGSSK